MLLKCCTQYASKFEKLSSGHILEKVTFHSSTKERQCQRMFKLLQNCTHFTMSKSNAQSYQVMLKVLQARLQQAMV